VKKTVDVRIWTVAPLLKQKVLSPASFDSMSLKRRWLVDVAGFEPAAPCLQSKHKFNLSHCFGCAYQFQALPGLLQSCSENAGLPSSAFFRDVH
jgi:hypothetical protein